METGLDDATKLIKIKCSPHTRHILRIYNKCQ